jgi:hypothetical protein
MSFSGAFQRRDADNGRITNLVSVVTAERGSLARAQGNQRIEYHSIEGQARAKRALARAK